MNLAQLNKENAEYLAARADKLHPSDRESGWYWMLLEQHFKNMNKQR